MLIKKRRSYYCCHYWLCITKELIAKARFFFLMKPLYLNKHNRRCLSANSLHWMMKTRTQTTFHRDVWSKIFADQIIRHLHIIPSSRVMMHSTLVKVKKTCSNGWQGWRVTVEWSLLSPYLTLCVPNNLDEYKMKQKNISQFIRNNSE